MKPKTPTGPVYDGYSIGAGNTIAYRFVEPSIADMNASQIELYAGERAALLVDAPDLEQQAADAEELREEADKEAEEAKAEADEWKEKAKNLADLLEKRAGGRLMDLTAEEYEAVQGVF